jgi:hypothetical protein
MFMTDVSFVRLDYVASLSSEEARATRRASAPRSAPRADPARASASAS